MSKAGGSDSKNTLYCSFCGKSQREVRKLVVVISKQVVEGTSPPLYIYSDHHTPDAGSSA